MALGGDAVGRRASSRIRDALAGGWPWLMVAVGAFGLLLPWLLSPVASDERYHYVAAPARLDGNLAQVLPWTVNDMQWRMRAGRIAPIGVLAQHVTYFLGMELASSTGVPLFVVHGIVKVLLLAAVVGSFWALLRQLRTPDGSMLDSRTRRAGVLLLAAGTVLGVTAASPSRNGWTTFAVLCIGGICVMFLVGAAALWVLHGWVRWGAARRVLGVVGLAVLGAFVVLSYELHWAAVAFVTVLVAVSGRNPWRALRRQPGDPARSAVLGGLLAGFVIMLAWTRAVIDANVEERYIGLELELGPSVLRTASLQVLNAVPGTGIPRIVHDLTRAQDTPLPLTGSGWLWGLLLAAGLLVALRRVELPAASTLATERGLLMTLGAAFAVSAVAAAAILSVSQQAHQIVKYPGDTYRGTPWIWVCLTGMLVVLLLAGGRAGPARRRAIVVVPVAGALLAGAVVWPYTVAAIETQRRAVDYQIWERAQAELVTGSADPAAVEHRCLLSRQATVWAGDSSYRRAYLPLYSEAFEYRWHRPWCP